MVVKTEAREIIAEKANSERVHLMKQEELRECQEALNALWAYYEEGVEGSMWFRHNLDILQKHLYADDEILD